MDRQQQTLWSYRLAGLAGGLLLCAGHLYGPLAVLQLGAFVPVLTLAARRQPGREALFLAGLYMGLGYSLPQMAVLRLPLIMTVVLLAKMVALLCVLVLVGGALIRRDRIGPWVFAAIVVVADWVNFATPPSWGMAQSFARSWSSYPWLIGFVSWTGILGVVFVVALMQGFAAHLLAGRSRRVLVLSLIGLMIVLGLTDIVAWGQSGRRLRVAAIGWADAGLDAACDPTSAQGFESSYAARIAEAGRMGARLVVSPELAFAWGRRHRSEWVGRFAALAKQHEVHLVVGYFNEDERDNRLMVVSDRGVVVGEYTKTHLTPLEPFEPGDGGLLEMTVDSVRLGVMICHDDNYTDLSRRYGRNGVQVMAVPTLDWPAVKDAHLQSSIYRAVESRYAIVRAARNGISAIISPTGRVLARQDHIAEGIGLLVADVPVGSGPTLFSRAGHWPVILCGAFLVIVAAGGLYRQAIAVESGV